MNVNQSQAGLRVLRHVLTLNPKQAGDVINRAKPYLTYDDDLKTLEFIRTHYSKTGQFPHPDTVLEQCAVFLPQTKEPLEFDLEQLRNRYVEDALRGASDVASHHLQSGNPVEALNSMIGALLPITQDQSSQQIFDARNIVESAFAHYKAQLDGTAPPVEKLGFPTLDKQGGIEDGDMLALVGRPSSGKTWLMIYLALKYWTEYGPVLFVTQEMSANQIEKRILPMVAQVNPTPMYQGTKHQFEVHGYTHDQYMQKLEDAAVFLKEHPRPFLIYDSKMAGTVADVENIATMHGVKMIFIDGAYMLRHPDVRLGRYQRVPENLDLMKQFTQRTGARIVSSWQFKRNAGKNDAGDAPDLDDIGYSHAIAEYMGVVLGLLENPKSVSQMDKKHVTIMKGRNGEVGGFDIHWNFNGMDFDEINIEETQADLTYL